MTPLRESSTDARRAAVPRATRPDHAISSAAAVP